jgi:putative nucleotidyltransferase with HDIG domain
MRQSENTMKSIQHWYERALDSISKMLLAGRKRTKGKGSKARSKKAVLQSRESADTHGATGGKAATPNLDSKRVLAQSLDEPENALLERVTKKIETGKFDLPHLPATSMALVNLAGKPGVDVNRVVQLISSDPSLAGELLRISNSVLYATHMPAGTLNEAVMRIGLKGLRTLIFSVSVKGTLLKVKGLASFSEEVWRQAFSVATLARKIAPLVGFDRERAFLVGLLHDVGKIALLDMLSKEMQRGSRLSPATVGRVFYLHHERAGEKLATAWRLDEELTSIAGQHHAFGSNETYEKAAALASLAHKLDLHLCFEDSSDFNQLVSAPEFESLGLPHNRRQAVLDQARRAFNEQGESDQATAA